MEGFSFKLLEQYLNNANLNIVIAKNGEGLSVSVLPQPNCKDEAFKSLKPIVLNGTAEELDAEFHKIIQKPLEKVSGIVSNVVSFEENADAAALKTKEATAKKEQIKKDKEKAEKKVEKAKEYLDNKDFDKAMFTINEALNLSPKLSSATKLKTEIEEAQATSNQVDMFGEDESGAFEVAAAQHKLENEEPTSMKEVGMEQQQAAIQEPDEDEEEEARAMCEAERKYNNNETINFG
jgi:PRTRC genetic system protein E